MKTHTITTYQLDELSDKAQKNAISNSFYVNIEDNDWAEDVIEDAKRIGALMGIDIETIFFSGFACQGDGAQFVGSYRYEPGSVVSVRADCPQDETLIRLAETLQILQKPWFYSLTASVRSEGRYCHEYCTAIDVSADDEIVGFDRGLLDVQIELTETLREYMRWIYAKLRDLHDDLTEDEQIRDSLLSDETEFLENGTPY